MHMTIEHDNETWIIEAGDAVIQKRAEQGDDALTPLERLIHCLWVADYGMRNAGDLITAGDVYPSFHDEAALDGRARMRDLLRRHTLCCDRVATT